MIKIEIKSILGDVIFTWEREDNTIRKTVEAAIAAKANLSSADLSYADLRSANLSSANLRIIKMDMFDVLLRGAREVPAFKNALIEGRIDGSTYDGECACLCGTLEKTSDLELKKRVHDARDTSRPIERFFLAIKKGDTPATSQFSKLALEWTEEFEMLINIATAPALPQPA